jgi:hypothetical protein
MINIIDAIRAINPTANVIVKKENINQITWLNDTPVISNEDILVKRAELQAAYDALQYQRDRAKEYPTWQNQMDMLWHSIDQDAALKQKYFAFHQAILAIKSKYPK